MSQSILSYILGYYFSFIQLFLDGSQTHYNPPASVSAFCISYFVPCCNQISDKKQLKEKLV